VSKPYPYFSGQSGARPQRLSILLKQRDSVLAGLRHKVLALQHLNALLGEFLDQPLLEHIQIAAVNDDKLVLAADSPVWGHRMRYLAPAIVEFLHSRGELQHIHDTRIVVRPPLAGFTQRENTVPDTAGISEHSALLLQQVAKELDNPELAERLQRLSRRCKPS